MPCRAKCYHHSYCYTLIINHEDGALPRRHTASRTRLFGVFLYCTAFVMRCLVIYCPAVFPTILSSTCPLPRPRISHFLRTRDNKA